MELFVKTVTHFHCFNIFFLTLLTKHEYVCSVQYRHMKIYMQREVEGKGVPQMFYYFNINPLSYGLFCAVHCMARGPRGPPYKDDIARNKRRFWWRQRGQSAPGHAKMAQTVPTSPPTHKKVIVYKVWGQCILRFKLVYTAKRLSKSTYEKSMKHSCKSNKAKTFLWTVVSLIVLVFRSRQKQYLP